MLDQKHKQNDTGELQIVTVLAQVLLAQWLPAKALEQVLAAVKAFQQAIQPVQAAPPQTDKPQATQHSLPPQLWLHCRLQVHSASINLQSVSDCYQLPMGCNSCQASAACHSH